jgi:D-alanyl-lipoteichoic acid acyltransferase DltB (MBOAT superfamily)
VDTSSLSLENYTLLNFLAYALYAPLYMAGPIITFNAFMRCLGADRTNKIVSDRDPIAQAEVHKSNTDVDVATKPAKQTEENIIWYLVRWVACLLLMEALLHYLPFFAVGTSGLLAHLSPGETAIVAYMLLKLMWLKFLLMWRFFRLWALLDGVNPPENMTRCMSNNHSLEGFWRGWHSSFNKFLVRYVYKPMGGKENQLLSASVIFLFVALWHDCEWKLFLWGGLNALFYALEVSVKRAVAASGLLERLSPPISALVCAVGGAVYIMVLIGVNLVGYGVGVGGVQTILSKMTSTAGLQTAAVCFYFLTIGVLIMQFLKRMGWSSA